MTEDEGFGTTHIIIIAAVSSLVLISSIVGGISYHIRSRSRQGEHKVNKKNGESAIAPNDKNGNQESITIHIES